MDSKKIRVSKYLILPEHNKVLSDNNEIRLEPRIMDVLLLLITHRNQVLSRELIAQELWPDTVVGLEVVTRAIFELRKLFNDDAKKPSFIETIPRKGYSFIHEVDFDCDKITATGHSGLSMAASDPVKVEKGTVRLGIRNLSVSALLLLTLLFIWWRFPGSSEIQYTKQLIPYSGGMASNKPAINSTGTHLAFVVRNTDRTGSQIYLTDLTTFTQTSLTDNSLSTYSPVWQAINDAWVYAGCGAGECAIYSLSEGKEEKALFKSPDTVREVSVFPRTGKLLVLSRNANANSLTILSAQNSKLIHQKAFSELEIQRTTIPANEAGVYFSAIDTKQTTNLYFYDWETGTVNIISNQFGAIRGLSAFKDKLLISGKFNSRENIWVYDPRSDNALPLFDHVPAEFLFSAVASAQDDIFYLSVRRDTRIFHSGLTNTQAFSRADSDFVDVKGAYDPIGDRLFFVSNRSGQYEVWQSHHAGILPLTRLQAELLYQPLISPDGTRLAFSEKRGGDYVLHVIEIGTGQVVMQHASSERLNPEAWEDNNSLLLSETGVSSAHNRIVSLNLLDGNIIQIATGELKLIRHRDNDSFGWFILHDNGELTSGEAGSTDERYELSTVVNFSDIEYAIVADGHLYVSVREEEKQFIMINLKTMERTTLSILPRNAYVSDIGVNFDEMSEGEVSSQGTRAFKATVSPWVIYDQLQEDISQIVMLQADKDATERTKD